jgi:hypothetical protein
MRSSGMYFAALVTALLSVIFLLMAFETWALFTGQKPITDYVHETIHTYPGWAFVMAIVLGILVGHVLWGGPVAASGKQRG